MTPHGAKEITLAAYLIQIVLIISLDFQVLSCMINSGYLQMNLHSTKSSDFTMNGQNNMIRKHVAIMIRQGTGSAVAPKIFFTPCPQKNFQIFHYFAYCCSYVQPSQ